MLYHGPLAFQCMCVMFGKQGPVCPGRNSSNKITLPVGEMPPQEKIIETFRLAVRGDKGNKSWEHAALSRAGAAGATPWPSFRRAGEASAMPGYPEGRPSAKATDRAEQGCWVGTDTCPSSCCSSSPSQAEGEASAVHWGG